jgi:hypothetical protein
LNSWNRIFWSVCVQKTSTLLFHHLLTTFHLFCELQLRHEKWLVIWLLEKLLTSEETNPGIQRIITYFLKAGAYVDSILSSIINYMSLKSVNFSLSPLLHLGNKDKNDLFLHSFEKLWRDNIWRKFFVIVPVLYTSPK